MGQFANPVWHHLMLKPINHWDHLCCPWMFLFLQLIRSQVNYQSLSIHHKLQASLNVVKVHYSFGICSYIQHPLDCHLQFVSCLGTLFLETIIGPFVRVSSIDLIIFTNHTHIDVLQTPIALIAIREESIFSTQSLLKSTDLVQPLNSIFQTIKIISQTEMSSSLEIGVVTGRCQIYGDFKPPNPQSNLQLITPLIQL